MAASNGNGRADDVTVVDAAQDVLTLRALLDLHDRAVPLWGELAEDEPDQLRALELLDELRDLHGRVEAMRPAVLDLASRAPERQAALDRLVESQDYSPEEDR